MTIPMRAGRGGIGFLRSACEQAFGFQFGLKLFEGELQRAGAFGLDVFGGDLKFAAIFVDGYAAADDDLQTVGGAKAKQARGRAEHDHANLGVAVFQGEIKMAGIGGAEIGDFAFDPGVGIFALDVGADGGDQVANFPDAALGRAEAESHLVGEGHCGQCTAGSAWLGIRPRSGGEASLSLQRSQDSPPSRRKREKGGAPAEDIILPL